MKYRQKSPSVDAIQLTEYNLDDVKSFIPHLPIEGPRSGPIVIWSSEGPIHVKIGQWIVRHPVIDFVVFDNSKFHELYEVII